MFSREQLALGAAVVATIAIAAAGIAYLLFRSDAAPFTERAEQHPAVEITAPKPATQAPVLEPPPAPASTPAVQAELPATNARVDTQAATGPAGTLGAAGTSTPPIMERVPPQPSPSQRIAARPPKSLGSGSDSEPLPNNRLSSRRCADIIQRVSLGEPLTPEEKDFLKQECGQ